MRSLLYILLFFHLLWTQALSQSVLSFDGQASAWSMYNSSNYLQSGLRYIPKVVIGETLDNQAVEGEFAMNIAGFSDFRKGYPPSGDGIIKPYRLWTRFSSQQIEIRIGLQKINFGSANMLRPMMWFDRLDPRDPLQLTDGVWAILGRYYFLNNANIWLWTIFPETRLRTWESIQSDQSFPEWGGRIQYPTGKGEIAFSFHQRNVDQSKIKVPNDKSIVAEQRFGVDGKWDLTVGCWFEATMTHALISVDSLRNQSLLSIGADYTFGIGNGLHVALEHLLAKYGEKTFEFDTKSVNFSALSLNYPLSITDQISMIFYLDWTSEQPYSFASWKHQLKYFDLHVMAWLNPESYRFPSQDQIGTNFAGQGFQLTIVYNHAKTIALKKEK